MKMKAIRADSSLRVQMLKNSNDEMLEMGNKSWFSDVKLVDLMFCKNWTNLYYTVSLLYLCF